MAVRSRHPRAAQKNLDEHVASGREKTHLDLLFPQFLEEIPLEDCSLAA